jgi:hypothetical protein
VPETPEITTRKPQDSHRRPLLALALEDGSLLLLYFAPKRPHGVRLMRLPIDGLYSELTGAPRLSLPANTARKEVLTAELPLNWYEPGSTDGYVTYRLSFKTEEFGHFTLNVGPLVCTLRHEAMPGVYEQQPVHGVRVALERLHISHDADGVPTAELMSSFLKARAQRPLDVLIGNDDHVLLVQREPQGCNGLIVVDTYITGAHQYHVDRVTGQFHNGIPAKPRDYVNHHVSERSIRESNTVMDCNWRVGDTMYQLHGIGLPISTYLDGPDGLSSCKLAASNPEWIDVVPDGSNLLIGFKPYTE